MTCIHCAKEFDNSVRTCPNCGRPLVVGAVAAFAASNAPESDLAAPAVNSLTDPTAPVPPTLGTTMSVTGAGSIRARLRPRETGEIFGEAFRLYRQNWKLFWAITLAFYVPFTILSILWGIWSSHVLGPPVRGDMASSIVTGVPALLLASAPIFLVYWGLIRAVSDKYLGRNTKFVELITPDSRLWGLVGANIVQCLVMFAPFVFVMGVLFPVLVAGSFARGPSSAAGFAVGFLAVALVVCFVVMVMAAIYWCIASSAAVIEGCGALTSLRRSANLVRGFGSKAFSMLFLPGLIAGLIKLIIQGSAEIAVIAPLVAKGPAALSSAGAMSLPATVGLSLASIIAMMIATPIALLPVVIFYYDLRVRKEGFDLQMLAEELGYGYPEVGGVSQTV